MCFLNQKLTLACKGEVLTHRIHCFKIDCLENGRVVPDHESHLNSFWVLDQQKLNGVQSKFSTVLFIFMKVIAGSAL